MSEAEERELDEAIAAGVQAGLSLKEAEELLRSAGNWGLFDMLGGGMFSTFVKHSKIDRAKACMEQAQQDLRRFSSELSDVNEALNLNIDIGSFLTVADYFFDNIFVDWLVQSKISEAREQTARAAEQVQMMLLRLRQMKGPALR